MTNSLGLIACLLLAPIAAFAERVDADLLLVGGTLYDGAGGEPVVGDLAIAGDRIVAVGQFDTGRVGKEIDCAGLAVAPGFIDLHNHSDGQKTLEDEATGAPISTCLIHAPELREAWCYLTQGCTTIVTGNCGGGALRVARFYERIDEQPAGVNVAHLIPQGAVRGEVIGKVRRAPSGAELQAMRDLVRQGMAEGAWGMTTGLQYVPSAYATTDEIVALAEVVAEHNGIYASHIRDEGNELLESVDEALTIGRRSGVAVHVSHFKASKRRNWGKVRAAAAMIEQAREEGLRATADQYPYAASSTSISAMLLPDEEREGGRKAVIDRLNDPEQLARLRPMIAENLHQRGKIMVAACPDYSQWVGKTIRQIAEEEGRDPVDVSLDLLKSSGEQGVSFSMDEHDVRWVMQLPWVATASDGTVKIADGTKPHPRSFGTFPRRIGRYAIEEGVVPLERAIRSASGLPADILGMKDRGYLQEGLVADVVVIDAATFRDRATFQEPFGLSTGVRWAVVNGRVAIDNGKPATLDAGRALRKKTD